MKKLGFLLIFAFTFVVSFLFLDNQASAATITARADRYEIQGSPAYVNWSASWSGQAPFHAYYIPDVNNLKIQYILASGTNQTSASFRYAYETDFNSTGIKYWNGYFFVMDGKEEWARRDVTIKQRKY